MTSRMIPLNELRFGHEADPPINARRVGRGEDIAELAASIAAHGLITNPKVKEIDRTFYVGIGNRRLAALRLLVEQNQLAEDWEVPCDEFVGLDDPREIALAEQINRAPLHEADELEEFSTLSKAGLSEVDIAKRFGIEPSRVKRILALGGLSPVILEAWREGVFNNNPKDSIRAFTLAPSIEAQEATFRRLQKANNLHPHSIRSAFGAENQEAARAIKIVGLDAYQAAGGRYTADLFGEKHVIDDPELALKLAEAKLGSTLEELRAEGWSWVSKSSDLPYSWTYAWASEKPGNGKPTADEKKAIKKLEKAVGKGTEGAAGELAALQKVIADRQWTPEQLAKAGAVLHVGHYGDVEIRRGVVKPNSAKPSTSASSGDKKEKAAPTISNAMMHRLSIQVTQAAQKALTEEPRVGLVALLAGFFTYSDGPIKVSANGMGGGYHEREQFASAFQRLHAMSDEDLFRVAAGIAGRALDLQSQNALRAPLTKGADVLAAAIDGDRMTAALRETWDAGDYFGGVSKAFVIDAIREALNDDEARKADKLKKAELVAFALANVPKTGWLPPELRAPTYSGPGKTPAAVIAPPPLEPDDDDIEEGVEEDEAA